MHVCDTYTYICVRWIILIVRPRDKTVVYYESMKREPPQTVSLFSFLKKEKRPATGGNGFLLQWSKLERQKQESAYSSPFQKFPMRGGVSCVLYVCMRKLQTQSRLCLWSLLLGSPHPCQGVLMKCLLKKCAEQIYPCPKARHKKTHERQKTMWIR